MSLQTIAILPRRGLCPSLPATMRGIVMSVPGVHEVTVAYETRSLSVTFDNTITSPEAILAAIGKETGVGMMVSEDTTPSLGEKQL